MIKPTHANTDLCQRKISRTDRREKSADAIRISMNPQRAGRKNMAKGESAGVLGMEHPAPDAETGHEQ
jgi:hypothetical protein